MMQTKEVLSLNLLNAEKCVNVYLTEGDMKLEPAAFMVRFIEPAIHRLLAEVRGE
jgi:hypothetical protein